MGTDMEPMTLLHVIMGKARNGPLMVFPPISWPISLFMEGYGLGRELPDSPIIYP